MNNVRLGWNGVRKQIERRLKTFQSAQEKSPDEGGRDFLPALGLIRLARRPGSVRLPTVSRAVLPGDNPQRRTARLGWLWKCGMREPVGGRNRQAP